MVVAVSRDKYMLDGGLGASAATAPGKLSLEILAYVTPDGLWKSHPCAQTYSQHCREFAHRYLSHAHKYVVVTKEGYGADVISKPADLSECFSYSTTASYSKTSITSNAVATDHPELFEVASQPPAITSSDERAVRQQLARLLPSNTGQLTTAQIEGVSIEEHHFVVISGNSRDSSHPFLFLIARWEAGRLIVQHRRKDEQDEEERPLGVVRLKSGSEFLVTTVSDPESQSFRIYGMRNGKLTLVYAGGGSSC